MKEATRPSSPAISLRESIFAYSDLTPAEKTLFERIMGDFNREGTPKTKKRGLSAESKKHILQIADDVEYRKVYTDEAHNFKPYDGDPHPPVMFYPGYAMMWNREKIPPSIGIHFDAHGIARGSRADQLNSLDNLLRNGFNLQASFHTTLLRNYQDNEGATAALGAIGPFTDGIAIVIGYPDKGLEHGVAGVILNQLLYPSVPLLQHTYPDVRFIKADELDKVGQPGPLTEMLNQKDEGMLKSFLRKGFAQMKSGLLLPRRHQQF